MTITIQLQPEVEQGLLAQAAARGVSLDDYLQEIITSVAHVGPQYPLRQRKQRTWSNSSPLFVV